MSVRSAAPQATCAALGFVLTMQSATAALHHAHKHHHRQVISQWRPCDANAAQSIHSGHIPQVTSCARELNPMQPVSSA